MTAFLEIIAKNYWVFLIITIFLMLSLIGYLVDKKMHNDAAPQFSLRKKEKKTEANANTRPKGATVMTSSPVSNSVSSSVNAASTSNTNAAVLPFAPSSVHAPSINPSTVASQASQAPLQTSQASQIANAPETSGGINMNMTD